MNHKPIRPAGLSINDSILKRVVRRLFVVATVTAFAVLGAVVLIEWMAGCGETYIDSKGVRHANECVFIR